MIFFINSATKLYLFLNKCSCCQWRAKRSSILFKTFFFFKSENN